jgi:cyclopropane-fatty-acyl-phospholipid synthase
MFRMVDQYNVGQAVGLTLSPSQRDPITAAANPRVEVRLESWVDHQPTAPYDAIFSVESIEAFARQGLTREEKVGVYRHLFTRCHEWLRPNGMFVLQAITYGNAGPEDFDSFIASEIFPESDLPRLAELAEGWERRFEVVTIRNTRKDYVRTLKVWLKRLKANRAEAVALVGEEVVVRFERYLRLSSFMFSQGTCDLLQIALRRIDAPRGLGAPDTQKG